MRKMYQHQQHCNYLAEKSGMKNMSNNNSKPTKKYHSKYKSTSGNNLPATIAKLEAYSKHLQSKENQTEEDGSRK